MIYTEEFWGEQGRLGSITEGEWADDEELLVDDLKLWAVRWMPLGHEESDLERREFGIRPLLTNEELDRLRSLKTRGRLWSGFLRCSPR
jgi:hypothetical protein